MDTHSFFNKVYTSSNTRDILTFEQGKSRTYRISTKDGFVLAWSERQTEVPAKQLLDSREDGSSGCLMQFDEILKVGLHWLPRELNAGSLHALGLYWDYMGWFPRQEQVLTRIAKTHKNHCKYLWNSIEDERLVFFGFSDSATQRYAKRFQTAFQNNVPELLIDWESLEEKLHWGFKWTLPGSSREYVEKFRQ